jgi:hypothetical protein
MLPRIKKVSQKYALGRRGNIAVPHLHSAFQGPYLIPNQKHIHRIYRAAVGKKIKVLYNLTGMSREK